MYKVLVTTREAIFSSMGSAIAISVVVIDFDTPDEAKRAVKQINEQSNTTYRQRAIFLQ